MCIYHRRGSFKLCTEEFHAALGYGRRVLQIFAMEGEEIDDYPERGENPDYFS